MGASQVCVTPFGGFMQKIRFNPDALQVSGVCRERLLQSIGQRFKWSSDDTGHWRNVPIYTPFGERIGRVDVFLRKRGARRLYVRCPICETWVSLGHLRTHVGSKRCDAIFLGSVGLGPVTFPMRSLIIEQELEESIPW